jgi:hypothetical protein
MSVVDRAVQLHPPAGHPCLLLVDNKSKKLRHGTPPPEEGRVTAKETVVPVDPNLAWVMMSLFDIASDIEASLVEEAQ